MTIEQTNLLDAVLYGYQQGEDAARAHALKIETALRMDLAELSKKHDTLRAERYELARMNDELTTNEWGRITQVLDAVSIKQGWSGAEVNVLRKTIKEVQDREKLSAMIDPPRDINGNPL